MSCLLLKTTYIKGQDAARKLSVTQDDLPDAAKRALAEAEARKKAAKALELPTELGGRNGPEPIRYGDWEKTGIAVDF
jgi:hypothetical protein